MALVLRRKLRAPLPPPTPAPTPGLVPFSRLPMGAIFFIPGRSGMEYRKIAVNCADNATHNIRIEPDALVNPRDGAPAEPVRFGDLDMGAMFTFANGLETVYRKTGLFNAFCERRGYTPVHVDTRVIPR